MQFLSSMTMLAKISPVVDVVGTTRRALFCGNTQLDGMEALGQLTDFHGLKKDPDGHILLDLR